MPRAVLNKPSKLTRQEFSLVKQHTVVGALLVADTMPNDIPDDTVITVALLHHERWDGEGYPTRLKGSEIPDAAQIVGLADALEALCSNRCYKNAFSAEVAFNMIKKNECGVFKPDLIERITTKQVEQQLTDIIARSAELSSINYW